MPNVNTFAVINQKGGVGKTTTVANLGHALASRGHDVCLIDLDPQSQLTLHLGIEAPGKATLYDVLTGEAELASAVIDVGEHLWIVPSVIDLAAAEMELVSIVGREQILADRLAASPAPWEYVLIDCPPSLGLLTLNALAAADKLMIPLQAHFLALQGLGKLLETVSLVQRRINPRLRVGGVIFCMFEKNTRLAGEVVADLTSFFAAAAQTAVPWADATIFQSTIRRNVKLAECPSHGKTIFDYEPSSHGAEDYNALAEEFLRCFPPALATVQQVEMAHSPAPPQPPAPPESTEPAEPTKPTEKCRWDEPPSAAIEPVIQPAVPAAAPPEPPEPSEPSDLDGPRAAEDRQWTPAAPCPGQNVPAAPGGPTPRQS